MAKSKNHTGHNQNYKNHRNGIKKTRRSKKLKIDGNMNCKFVRNMKAVNKGMECSAAEKAEKKQQQREAQKELEEKRKAAEEERRAFLLEERDKAAGKKLKK
eukprot:CAMPEP_0172716124 /NCGR_PEP_ID=MMETSP1074-20121228/67941_1 /TAXON_ID=2916 /ORGANISM="Ceratium fusus, Strain PA161109" /LENGTH=101 /DNA_ID=CAMNT_0013540775 /DNA_START=59 /DNA_END=364 /DNA_ORIENTATION=-